MEFQHIATIGLVLDIIGVILLFRFGLPPSVDIRPRVPYLGRGDPEEIKKARLYDKISLVALVVLIAGFVLQIIGNHPEWFGVS